LGLVFKDDQPKGNDATTSTAQAQNTEKKGWLEADRVSGRALYDTEDISPPTISRGPHIGVHRGHCT
jgi:hypothetical protein